MSMDMRISPADHASLPWRINGLAADFELIDAWRLPVRGALEAFSDLLRLLASLDPGSDEGSRVSRALFAIRGWLGQRMGWDAEGSVNTLPIPGCTEASLRERLAPDLVAPLADRLGHSEFRPVFALADEAAFEVSNPLVHAILHVGWVPQSDGSYRGQMGVYVKHRGRFGRLYMAAIAPFRHQIVYPALMRRIAKAWDAREGR